MEDLHVTHCACKAAGFPVLEPPSLTMMMMTTMMLRSASRQSEPVGCKNRLNNV